MIDLFTKQERTVILFLVLGLVVGGGIKLFKIRISDDSKPNGYNYSVIEQKLIKKSKIKDSALKFQSPQIERQQVSGKKSKITETNLSIDINKAQLEDIIILPSIGPVIAQRIINYRNQHGHFQNIEELKNVKGIGSKKFEKIKPFIHVGNFTRNK